MIKIIDGDLLESGADIIAHQVNCCAAMNSGVAKQIRKRFPRVYEEYMNLFKSKDKSQSLLGTVQVVEIPNENRFILNLFAQGKYGYDGKQYTNMKALRKCLEGTKEVAKNLELILGENIRVAMPYKISCARGGANWDEVYAIIEEVFKDCDVELWRLDKG